MSFNINNELMFTGSFQFLVFSLDSLAKDLGEDDFKCLNQELDNKV